MPCIPLHFSLLKVTFQFNVFVFEMAHFLLFQKYYMIAPKSRRLYCRKNMQIEWMLLRLWTKVWGLLLLWIALYIYNRFVLQIHYYNNKDLLKSQIYENWRDSIGLNRLQISKSKNSVRNFLAHKLQVINMIHSRENSKWLRQIGPLN